MNFESLGLGSSRQNATFYFSHLPHQKSSGKKHDWLITPNFNEFPFQVLSKNASFSIFFLCIFPAFGVTPLLPVDGCWAGAERPQQSSQQREDCGADLVTFEWYLLGQRPHRGWSFFFKNWIPDRRIQDGNDGVGGSLFFFLHGKTKWGIFGATQISHQTYVNKTLGHILKWETGQPTAVK